jgi:voltage-gated potassium channel Kch
LELYLYAYYWAVTTLTTVGYGDISGGTTSERILCMVWMMVGVAFYSFTVGSIASVISSMDAKSKTVESILQEMNVYAKET